MQEREITESKTKSKIKTKMETTNRNTITKTKNKTNTESKIKTRWVTLLKWTRYTKTIGDHEEAKGTRTKKKLHVFFGAVGLQPFLVFCVFLFFYKNTVFPWKRGFFVHFSVSPFFFSLVSFTFPFSLSVSLFLVSRFFVFSLFSCFFVVLPCFLLFFLALFLCFGPTNKKQHQTLHLKGFFSSIISVLGCFLCCRVFQIPFLIFVFVFFQLCVWSTQMFSFFKEDHF